MVGTEEQRRAFAELARLPVEPGVKGIPPQALPLPLGDIGKQGWGLLDGDLTLPVAVLLQSALTQNSAAMRDYLTAHGMAISPHGKTTMAPQLFALQLEDGAWGMTISTVQHLAICRRFGFNRVLIANQVIGAAEIAYLFASLRETPALELYCLVDSTAGVALLARHRDDPAYGRLRVLIEMGVAGGRAGCRSAAEAMTVARAAHDAGLSLAGVEGFEGILPDAAAVDVFLDVMCDTAADIAEAGLFAPGPVMLTAGGTAFYDRVAAKLGAGRPIAQGTEIISRSGCYLTHDSGAYEVAFAALRERAGNDAPRAFSPALMVFAHVQSRPEPGKAILTMGRRDAGTDAGLPVPMLVFRAGRDEGPVPAPDGLQVTGLNDQHTHLACPEDADLAVGDIVGFGVSHPCTTFDKWQVLLVIDDDYRVIDAIKTFF